MLRQILAVAMPSLAVALTGCGGSASTPATASSTPTAVAPGADAACATANTAVAALKVPSASSTQAELAVYFDQFLVFVQKEQVALTAAPDGAVLTTSFGNLVTKVQAVATAARGSDLTVLQAAVNAVNTANLAFQAAGRAANLPDCAK